jgi:phospholipid N-methyltransferase
MEHDATYSPDDNKLRIYPAYRLDRDDYARLKRAGYKWAPKQELFVAPMWTPQREDIAIEFCGEIGDEDTSLVDRAEERAERFENYSEKRLADARAAKKTVSAIADNIPLGQPILVGHHSEKHARKDAQRIENGMRKAIKMWETSKYWEQRASGALRHAKYKERPDVRARRIKKIEAAQRKTVKNIEQAKSMTNLWLTPVILSRGRALAITNCISLFYCKFPLDKYPRNPPSSQYEGDMSLYSALDGGVITPKQARNLHVPALERGIAYNKRWLSHYDNRLKYEKAMLGEQGRLDLIEKKPRPKQLPMLNYRAPEGIDVINPPYYAEKITHMRQVKMTKAEYRDVPKDYKGGKIVGGTHRIKVCIGAYIPEINAAAARLESTEAWSMKHRYYAVFLTDSKSHPIPEPAEEKPETVIVREIKTTEYKPPEKTEFDDLKSALEDGVKVVYAPQLFPTPPKIAEMVVDAAGLEPGLTILEPSAGTGNLVRAALNRVDTEVLAYEINGDLCKSLSSTFPSNKLQVRQRDFLEVTDFQGCYPRIIMNPPFEKGQDIKHIEHALKFLKPGGRLVALCANGPRQRKKLIPIAERSGGYWEDLPAGTFKESGTNVNTAIVVIEG